MQREACGERLGLTLTLTLTLTITITITLTQACRRGGHASDEERGACLGLSPASHPSTRGRLSGVWRAANHASPQEAQGWRAVPPARGLSCRLQQAACAGQLEDLSE